MVNSLLGLVKDQLSDKMIGRAGSLLGLPTGDARSAVMSGLPAVLSGLGSKVASKEGASSLLSLIKDNNLGESTLTNMVDRKDDIGEMGSNLASSVFGGSQNSIIDKLASLSGIGKDKSSKLLSFLTPAVLGAVGKRVSDKNLDAAGLQSLFSDYKGGLGSVKAAASSATGSVKSAATSASNTVGNAAPSGGGGGFLKWLLPLLLIGGALWWFMGRGGADTNTAKGDKMEQMDGKKMGDKKGGKKMGAADDHSGHDHAGHDHSDHDGHDHGGKKMAKGAKDAATGVATTAAGAMEAGKEGAGKMANAMSLSVDADGNLMRGDKLIAKAGTFSEKDGSYVDASGKKLGLIAKVGKAIGDAAKTAGGAVAGAATKSADAIKGVFSKAFSKKDSGYSYSLTDISWEEGGNKITNFSKNEIMGLAAALKENADGKIEVQVNGADKGLSKQRASVIRDQLVTLGVKANQISAKGMGDGDASSGKLVKIVVK
jgi:outer membrane protein OmpA-like peptidoglycan-associated protein